MFSMIKNIVSSEKDVKKYHLKSYHEMLEVALLKDYELNQKFLKSIQEEFGISEYEHSIIVQAITKSNAALNTNIVELLQKMEHLSDVNNSLYDDFTVEIAFLKNIIQEEFNHYSTHLFNLLDGIYMNHKSEFQACREAFSYEQNELIGLNSKVYEFLSPTIANELEKIHKKIHTPTLKNEDNNLKMLSKLLEIENENILIATLVATKNYPTNSFDLSAFEKHTNSEIINLVEKIQKEELEIHVYEKMAFLNRVPLFSALDFSELYSVANSSKLQRYQENTSVIEEGENTHNLYVIISGDVDVYKNSKKINELSSGDFFGEIAIVAMTKRTATIVATTDLCVLVFSEDAFNILINKYPNISVQIMKVMTKRLLQNNS